MKKLSIIAAITLVLIQADSARSQQPMGLFNYGFDAFDELVYSYQFGYKAVQQTPSQYTKGFMTAGLDYLVQAYNGALDGDFLSASDNCYYAYVVFYNSGLIDQFAFDAAFATGAGLQGNMGTSNVNAWFAAWLAYYASNDYYAQWRYYYYRYSQIYPYYYYYNMYYSLYYFYYPFYYTDYYYYDYYYSMYYYNDYSYYYYDDYYYY